MEAWKNKDDTVVTFMTSHYKPNTPPGFGMGSLGMAMMKPLKQGDFSSLKTLTASQLLVAKKILKGFMTCLEDDSIVPMLSLFAEYKTDDMFAKGSGLKAQSVTEFRRTVLKLGYGLMDQVNPQDPKEVHIFGLDTADKQADAIESGIENPFTAKDTPSKDDGSFYARIMAFHDKAKIIDLPDVLASAPSADQLFFMPGHIEFVIEKLAEAREEAVLAGLAHGDFFDGEQEAADIFSNELRYKDWPELVGNLKRAAEAKITALGPHQLVLIADEPHSSCLVLKPKKGPFIAIDTGTDYHDMTDEEFSAAVLGYDKVTHQILGDTDVPKVLIAYLRLLKERDLDFPDDEYYIQKSVEDSIEKLGIEGPPGIFAIVHKTVTKVGKKKMHTFDTVLWDMDEKEIADIDARFVDGQTIRGDEDWVFFWDGYEWINKKKSEDVESSDEDDSDDD